MLSLLFSDRDPFMAISILFGYLISVPGIPWVVTKAVPIRFAPIGPLWNRTFASFPLMKIVFSSAWCALIVVGRVVFVAA